MPGYAWVLEVRPGYEEEYKKRHDEIWPEMLEALKEAGISNYNIFRHGLTLFGYFETELFSVDSNAVFIFFVFQPDNYRTFTHPISHFESFSCLRINLKFIKAAHFRVQRHPISRLYCSCCIYQFTDRTFFQFDNRYRSSNVIGCVLWSVTTACQAYSC